MKITRLISATLGALLLLGAGAASGAAPTKGTRIVSVRAVPVVIQRGSGVLSRQRLNTVTASSRLGFRIEVRNEGSTRTSNETVSLIIRKPVGGSILIARTLRTIAPNQTKTLTFSNLGAIPFASRTRITVALRTGASTAYPVIFSLPSGNAAGTPMPVPAASRVVVPNLVGMNQQVAIAHLESLGLQILVQPVRSPQRVGVVVAEAPEGGARISAGSIVKLAVSR
ncbi:MAG TPA: PASTA domain-containing protein [Gaiellaceae bacterium]|jgi:hypothetical protein|nr:PASTA domain-containing protein [Gaiellaceae bacterium]